MLGLYRDNGKENGNDYNGLYRDYRAILGLYKDNGKENGTTIFLSHGKSWMFLYAGLRSALPRNYPGSCLMYYALIVVPLK